MVGLSEHSQELLAVEILTSPGAGRKTQHRVSDLMSEDTDAARSSSSLSREVKMPRCKSSSSCCTTAGWPSALGLQRSTLRAGAACRRTFPAAGLGTVLVSVLGGKLFLSP